MGHVGKTASEIILTCKSGEVTLHFRPLLTNNETRGRQRCVSTRAYIARPCKNHMPQPFSENTISGIIVKYLVLTQNCFKCITNHAASTNVSCQGWRFLLFKPGLAKSVLLKTNILVHPLPCKKASFAATETGLASITYDKWRFTPTS